MRSLPPHELYALKLQCLDLGVALFEPNPNGAYDFVRIGDVGYISEDGKFMKLFNAFSDRDSQANVGSHFPDDFERMAEIYRYQDRLEPVSPGCRRSQSVAVVGGSLSISGPMSEFIAGGSLMLSCSSNTGAALITKYKGKRQKALASTAMEDYMKSHVMSWLRLAQNLGRPVQMHDLIFVKECILTGDWANVSWNSTSCESSVGFTVGLPAMSSVEVSFWGQWQQHVDVPKRQGPDREVPIPDGETPIFDQCAFIKGIRIAERTWYDKLAYQLKATSRRGGIRPEQSMLKVLSDRDFKVKPVGDRGSGFHTVRNAYDALAIYMFEKSKAQYALIDERDIYYMNLHEAGDLDELCLAMLNMGTTGPEIGEVRNVGGETVARLFWKETGFSPDRLNTKDHVNEPVLLDESMVPLDVPKDDLSRPRTSFDNVAEGDRSLEPTSTGATKNESSLDDLPPPPLPPQCPKSGYRTLLFNYVARKRISDFKVVHKVKDSGSPEWITTYRINGVEYGRSAQPRKKASAEEAARQALMKLWNEQPDQRGDMYIYLPIFKQHLSDHGLTETIVLSHDSKDKPDQGWVCRIHRDEKVLGKGEGHTKRMAAEKAAIDAAHHWTNLQNS